jgi:hypothetical protein
MAASCAGNGTIVERAGGFDQTKRAMRKRKGASHTFPKPVPLQVGARTFLSAWCLDSTPERTRMAALRKMRDAPPELHPINFQLPPRAGCCIVPTGMAQAARKDEHPHWTADPLVRAFALSLALHIGGFTAFEIGARLDLWQFSPLRLLTAALRPDLAPGQNIERALSKAIALEKEREAEERSQEMPIEFVDVDPTQASETAPDATKYYGSVNSMAANLDTTRSLTVPELDGTQDKVRKTMDSQRASRAQPLQPSVVAPQQPQSGKSATAVKPQPVVADSANPPREATPPSVKPPPSADKPQAPGDILVARARPMSAASATVTVAPSESSPGARVRPRTVAAALAQRQVNPNSAMVGEKMKQTGGVKRFSIGSTMDVAASPLGSYDAEFIAAVQHCWFGLLEQQKYSLDRVGKVVVEFRLSSDGRITDVKAVESDVGDIYTSLCQLAITKPAPYKSWPADVRKMVGSNHRDVRFTFYY